MAIESPRWTRDDLERFPNDGNRYEVLDGELLVTPQATLRHQLIAAHLFAALYSYCAEHRIGVALSPARVRWAESELQPDVEAILGYLGDTNETWDSAPLPSIVVEILSPSGASRWRDLDVKKDAYLRLGIGTYWVVDPEERCAHVWEGTADESIVSDRLLWRPHAAIAPFEITIEALLGPPPK